MRVIPFIAALALLTPLPSLGQTTTTQILAAECITKGKNADGSGHNCYSDWTVLVAPEGFVIAKDSLKGGFTSRNGGGNQCQVEWAEPRDIMAGITQPSVLRLRAYAETPGGGAFRDVGVRGWSKCKFEVNLVRISPVG